MCVWRMVGWRGMVFFWTCAEIRCGRYWFWRMEKWQRLTMGSQREMMNEVFVSFVFSDQELTVFLPSSGIESNPQDRVKRFPRL